MKSPAWRNRAWPRGNRWTDRQKKPVIRTHARVRQIASFLARISVGYSSTDRSTTSTLLRSSYRYILFYSILFYSMFNLIYIKSFEGRTKTSAPVRKFRLMCDALSVTLYPRTADRCRADDISSLLSLRPGSQRLHPSSVPRGRPTEGAGDVKVALTVSSLDSRYM